MFLRNQQNFSKFQSNNFNPNNVNFNINSNQNTSEIYNNFNSTNINNNINNNIYNNNYINNNIINNNINYNYLLREENTNINKIKQILDKTNTELKNQIKELQNNNEKNNIEIENKMKLITNLQNEIDYFERENKNLREKYEQIKIKSEEIININNVYNEEYEKEKEEYNKLLQDNYNLKDKYNDILNKFKEEFQKNERKNLEYEREIKFKTKENEKIINKNTELQNNLNSLEIMIENMKKTIEILNNQDNLNFRKKNIEDLNNIMILKENEIEKKNKIIMDLININKNLQKQQENKINTLIKNKNNV